MDYHISTALAWTLGLLAIWDLVWRGFALWRAGRHNQKAWFVVILIINSVGILPIAYLLLTKDKQDSA